MAAVMMHLSGSRRRNKRQSPGPWRKRNANSPTQRRSHGIFRLADRYKTTCRSAGRSAGGQSPTAPFIVRDGAAENVDLVAEWRIVDASWYEIFAKAGLERVFKVLMKLDDQAKEVRSVDQEWSVEWHAGVPTLSLAATWSRGQSRQVSFGRVYGITKQGRFGEIYRYNFSTAEIKHLCRMPRPRPDGFGGVLSSGNFRSSCA